jgi:hypothetical protein
MPSFSYTSAQVPDNYVCSGCGRKGVKLWRPYQGPADRLLCAGCLAAEQGKDITGLRSDGTHFSVAARQFVDSIGWWVPAVPTEHDPHVFCGCAAIPPTAYAWWAGLPNN